MSRYRALHCLMWNDDKFPFASDDCQLVFFHLLTTPLSTPFGCYKASLEALAAEKRWPLERYQKAFMEAFHAGFAKYDERHQVILLPHFLKYNPPNNPNVLKAWRKIYDELPDCPLKHEFYRGLKAYLEGFHEGFLKAFAEGWPKPMPIQEQEQEQEQKQATSTARARETTNGEGEDAVIYVHPKVQDAVRQMLPCFHVLADQTELNGQLWDGLIHQLNEERVITLYQALPRVNNYYVTHPTKRPATGEQAMRAMRYGIQLAIDDARPSGQPRRKRHAS